MAAHRDVDIMVTMGFDEDLNKALANAKSETAKFIAEQRQARARPGDGAHCQNSDCRVTQVVDIKKGVHCITAKDPGKSLPSRGPPPRRPSTW